MRDLLQGSHNHDFLQTRYNRKYDYKRALYKDPTIIRDWFQFIQNTTAKYGIQNVDIYNFDEIRFQINIISIAKVVIASERVLRPVIIQLGNCEWITAIEYINSNSWSLPSIIIFKSKTYNVVYQDLVNIRISSILLPFTISKYD